MKYYIFAKVLFDALPKRITVPIEKS